MFQVQIDQYPYDLPRETKAVLSVLKEQAFMMELEKFQNDAIFELQKRTDEVNCLDMDDVVPQKVKEINDWIR